MNQKKTGQFIRELRKAKGLTQEQLAEVFQVSGRTISRWETGINMPDISLLVEIADFFDVDVRELIEGERKSEIMDEEVRDVAAKMADYAEKEKSRLLTGVRLIGIIGVIVTAISIILQCKNYTEGQSLWAIATSLIAFIAVSVLTLYVNGILQKIEKKQLENVVVIVGVIGIILVVFKYIIFYIFLVLIVVLESIDQGETYKGIEEYNKTAILEENGSDFNSDMRIFPDDISEFKNGEYIAHIDSALIDTDAYIFLKADYNSDTYLKEKDRLSNINCVVSTPNGKSWTQDVYYDDKTYKYPAYIATDGFTNTYEYALLDEENKSIIYVFLSYPDYNSLTTYKDYLKVNSKDYLIPDGKSRELFTIYAHQDPDMPDCYVIFDD